jgi:hypothetical protein
LAILWAAVNCGKPPVGPEVAKYADSEGGIAVRWLGKTAATVPQRVEFVRALWEMSIPCGPYRYYDGMFYMLGLLNVAGEFRA